MKQFKKIAIAVVGTVLFFVVLDFVGGLVCDKLYHGAKYSLFARQNYVLNESEDDIIILGSSRASHHYIPSIFTDSLGMSCYNAGSDGMCIYYHYALLSAMIERGHKPKLVIYEVMDLDAQKSQEATFTLDAALDRFAPHYGEFAAIDSLFGLRGKMEKVKLQSKLYRYNSQMVQLLTCRFIQSREDNGYERVDGQLLDAVIPNDGYDNSEIENLKVEYFKKLIEKLQANGIPLVMVQSPKYTLTGSHGIDILKQIAEEYGIDFIDMKNDEVLIQPQYFRDNMHLSHEGATLFSGMLAGKITKDK